MFDNIGRKIKGLAKAITVIGIIFSVFIGLIVLFDEEGIGLYIIVFGCLSSWIGSMFLYGFGQLIENTDKLVMYCEGGIHGTQPNAAPPKQQDTVEQPVRRISSQPDWVCSSCGFHNLGHILSCQSCGVTKHWSEAQGK